MGQVQIHLFGRFRPLAEPSMLNSRVSSIVVKGDDPTPTIERFP